MLSLLSSVYGCWEWNIWLGDWFYSLYLKGVMTAWDVAADWYCTASRVCTHSLSQGQSVGINFSDSSLGSKIAARWGAECIQGRKSFWHMFPLKANLEPVCIIECLKLVWGRGHQWVWEWSGSGASITARKSLWDKRRNFDFILQAFKMALGIPLSTIKYTVIGSREELRLFMASLSCSFTSVCN